MKNAFTGMLKYQLFQLLVSMASPVLTETINEKKQATLFLPEGHVEKPNEILKVEGKSDMVMIRHHTMPDTWLMIIMVNKVPHPTVTIDGTRPLTIDCKLVIDRMVGWGNRQNCFDPIETSNCLEQKVIHFTNKTIGDLVIDHQNPSMAVMYTNLMNVSMQAKTFEMNVRSGIMTSEGVFQTLQQFLQNPQPTHQIAAFFQIQVNLLVELSKLTGYNLALGVDEIYTVGRVCDELQNWRWVMFSLLGLGNEHIETYHGWASFEIRLLDDDNDLVEMLGVGEDINAYPILKLPEGLFIKNCEARQALDMVAALIPNPPTV